eukprot:CAMPEP_0202960272 /NCGR_PEP_ID=MMETSP1396-20130829/4415_1 /ASSEMBLY_ACC=CAM_ASM_000872 /TAXON_ID= /ORGANISM="Pseudokeronopsis sp., Strain Brazil" /LENGTH=33 /DNA_ID= /DNA_START= /DNA_END= /DNA_ORIENTATION=
MEKALNNLSDFKWNSDEEDEFTMIHNSEIQRAQ